mmetsp:Transcript_10233/g.31396  ORF Transcript_10233/g.31396 Transcript_10233/m.31396 type:complete len:349 (+) Transcript_10233:287-1333(+)
MAARATARATRSTLLPRWTGPCHPRSRASASTSTSTLCRPPATRRHCYYRRTRQRGYSVSQSPCCPTCRRSSYFATGLKSGVSSMCTSPTKRQLSVKSAPSFSRRFSLRLPPTSCPFSPGSPYRACTRTGTSTRARSHCSTPPRRPHPRPHTVEGGRSRLTRSRRPAAAHAALARQPRPTARCPTVHGSGARAGCLRSSSSTSSCCNDTRRRRPASAPARLPSAVQPRTQPSCYALRRCPTRWEAPPPRSRFDRSHVRHPRRMPPPSQWPQTRCRPLRSPPPWQLPPAAATRAASRRAPVRRRRQGRRRSTRLSPPHLSAHRRQRPPLRAPRLRKPMGEAATWRAGAA